MHETVPTIPSTSTAGRATRRVAAALTLSLFVSATGLAQTGSLDPPLILSIDSRYVDLGGTSTFTITGPPSATFFLEGADRPQQTQSEWGTHFLEAGSTFLAASGVLSQDGETQVTVEHPESGELEGRLRYFQVRGEAGVDKGLSNSIAVRFSPAPSGSRQSESFAVTPDGTTALVVHKDDGTVSLIDATADRLVFDTPVSVVPAPGSLPPDIAIDPEGRHAFVVNPQLRTISILDIVSGSVAGELEVPAGCDSIAFAFTRRSRMIHVTNQRDGAVLSFIEEPLGTFTLRSTTPLEGMGPGPMAPMGRRLVVGHRQSLELEVVLPGRALPTVNRIPLGSPPLDILVSGPKAYVPTFTPSEEDGVDGHNELLEVDLVAGQVVGAHLRDHGTDYMAAAVSDEYLVLAGSGSGVVVIADADTFEVVEVIELAPGDPPATPQKVAFVVDPESGLQRKLYVLNRFRETIRPIDLSSGPPFAMLPEIPLAHSGQPRVPLVDLTDVENGEWMFNSVTFFNGTATNPNPTTCGTCHTRGFSFNVTQKNKQTQPLFDLKATRPYGHKANTESIGLFAKGAFDTHGKVGGEMDDHFRDLLVLYQRDGIPAPPSPHLEADGSLSPQAEAGRLIFEGVANCASCHPAPLFIPEDEAERTIEEGVGTGLAPANIPSLRGVWATAPYFAAGGSATLLDVLTRPTGDKHGNTSILTEQEIEDLIAYLLSL